MSELVSSFPSFLAAQGDLIGSVAVALFSAFLLWLFRTRVKLEWGSTSANFHNFVVDEGRLPLSVWTEKFFIQNTGRQTANNVEIVFTVAPTSYNLFPPRKHEKSFLDDGKFIIHVPHLAPKELLIVDVVDMNMNRVEIVSVNSPDTITTEVEFRTDRQYGPALYAIVFYLMLAGLIGSIYLLIQLLS